jgi:hypothetical protein
MVADLRKILCPSLVAAAAILIFSVTPARAVTCEEVRDLTETQLAYWSKRLQLKPAELAALLHNAFCDSSQETLAHRFGSRR